MAKTIQKQQRFPEPLLILIDQWAKGSGMDRTAAVNHMCRCFLEAIEVEGLRREVVELRAKVVALAMGSEHCKFKGWPKPCGSSEPSRCSMSKVLCSQYIGPEGLREDLEGFSHE